MSTHAHRTVTPSTAPTFVVFAMLCWACAATPRVSNGTASEIADDVASHLGPRSIDIVVHGSYGYGLICGSGIVVVLGAPPALARQVLQAAQVTSWGCSDGLCTSEVELEVGPIACALSQDCGDPVSEHGTPHLGGNGHLVMVFEGTSNAPLLVGLVLGAEGDARADLDRARRIR